MEEKRSTKRSRRLETHPGFAATKRLWVAPRQLDDLTSEERAARKARGGTPPFTVKCPDGSLLTVEVATRDELAYGVSKALAGTGWVLVHHPHPGGTGSLRGWQVMPEVVTVQRHPGSGEFRVFGPAPMVKEGWIRVTNCPGLHSFEDVQGVCDPFPFDASRTLGTATFTYGEVEQGTQRPGDSTETHYWRREGIPGICFDAASLVEGAIVVVESASGRRTQHRLDNVEVIDGQGGSPIAWAPAHPMCVDCELG